MMYHLCTNFVIHLIYHQHFVVIFIVLYHILFGVFRMLWKWNSRGETYAFVAHQKSEMRIQFDSSVSSAGGCSSQCLFSHLLNHGIKFYVSHWSFMLMDSTIYCLLFYCVAVVTFVIIVMIFFLCILILSIAIMQYFKSVVMTQWDLLNSEYL